VHFPDACIASQGSAPDRPTPPTTAASNNTQNHHPQMFSEEMKDFLVKVFEKSGISPDGTYLPAAIHPCIAKVWGGVCRVWVWGWESGLSACIELAMKGEELTLHHATPPRSQEPCSSIPEAMNEARAVMIGAVNDLLDKTGDCVSKSLVGWLVFWRPGQIELRQPPSSTSNTHPPPSPHPPAPHRIPHPHTHTGTHPSEIDILITNCSIFCPTPSLSSMLVNHFKFRNNIQVCWLGEPGG